MCHGVEVWRLKSPQCIAQVGLAWISSDYFESLLLPQLLRGENDSKQSDEFQAKVGPLREVHQWVMAAWEIARQALVKDGGRRGGGRGDECIGKGKGSFAISLGGGGGAYHLH